PYPSFDAFDAVLFEPAELLGFALEGCRVDLRIGDRHVQFESVICDPAVALFENHIDAVRITEMIDPRSVVHTGSRNYKRIAVPAAGGISPPSRQVRIHERLAPIGPDRAKSISPFEVLVKPIGKGNELDGIGINQSA